MQIITDLCDGAIIGEHAQNTVKTEDGGDRVEGGGEKLDVWRKVPQS